MKFKNRIREKCFDAAMIITCVIGTGIYSCFAQPNYTIHGETDSTRIVKNSERYIINLATELNLSARAVALTDAINSPFAELKPTISLTGDRLYFSRSNHPGNVNGIDDHEDIWYSDVDKDSKKMREPKRLDSHLNNSGPNFITSISMTGDTVFLGNQYTKKGRMRAGFSYSINDKGVWSIPKKIEIKDEYNFASDGHAHVSHNSSIILLSVHRADSYGERDLYVSFWNKGVATQPLNLGKVVNTLMEESSPYLSSDKKTLYFASKGHHGYGGYDIYRSKRLDESWTNWSEPENLGPVVNGPMDEEFFSVTHCRKFGFFSKQVTDKNIDLYKIDMTELFAAKKAIFR